MRDCHASSVYSLKRFGKLGRQPAAKPLDHRSDIFSLGVLLYEMLAGRRPFQGKSPVETMHAIIRDPAPPLAAQPLELNEILDKTLEKDPKDRYQHAGDLALDLRRFRKAQETKSLLSMRPANIEQPRRSGWALAAAALVFGLAGGWFLDPEGAKGRSKIFSQMRLTHA